jgi:sec-independent protein translocase protein TatA
MTTVHLFAFPTVNAPTLILLFFIGILLFGKRLPEMGRVLAQGIREFQRGMSGIEDSVSGSPLSGEPALAEAARPQLPHRVTKAVPTSMDHEANGTVPPPIA